MAAYRQLAADHQQHARTPADGAIRGLSNITWGHVLDKIRKNIFFGFIDYFYHIIDLFNRKFYL
jgi:hypothetical protein